MTHRLPRRTCQRSLVIRRKRPFGGALALEENTVLRPHPPTSQVKASSSLRHRRPELSRTAPAFTLAEILLVVALVIILMTLALVAARSLRTDARVKQTQLLLAALNNVATEYRLHVGSDIAHNLTLPNEPGWFTSLDPDYDTNETQRKARLLIRRFVFAASQVPSCRDLLLKIDPHWDPKLHPDARLPAPYNTLRHYMILDAWGTPLRYFKDYTGSPNSQDAPTHPSPFFVSAGPDTHFGFIGDDPPTYNSPLFGLILADANGDNQPDAADNLYSFAQD